MLLFCKPEFTFCCNVQKGLELIIPFTKLWVESIYGTLVINVMLRQELNNKRNVLKSIKKLIHKKKYKQYKKLD